jgi:hypothetical protein
MRLRSQLHVLLWSHKEGYFFWTVCVLTVWQEPDSNWLGGLNFPIHTVLESVACTYLMTATADHVAVGHWSRIIVQSEKHILTLAQFREKSLMVSEYQNVVVVCAD